jgi:hypothetical protein
MRRLQCIELTLLLLLQLRRHRGVHDCSGSSDVCTDGQGIAYTHAWLLHQKA